MVGKVPSGLEHFEAVAAPAHRHRNAARLVGGDIHDTVDGSLRLLDRLETPVAVLAIPLIAGVDPEQLVAQAAAGERRAIGRGGNYVERRGCVVAERRSGEQRLHADHRGGRNDRERQLALDGAAARLGHADSQPRFHRPGDIRQGVDVHIELGLAVGVGARQILDRDVEIVLAAVIVGAELVTGKAGTGRCGLHLHLSRDFEIARRRPIKEAGIERNRDWPALPDGAGGARQFELHAVGHIVFDHETGLAHGRTLRIGEGAHAPGSGRGGRGDAEIEGPSPDALVGDHGSPIFYAIGTLDHERERHGGRGSASLVAQQRGDMHGLAGPIDTTLRVDEGVEPSRRRTPGDPAVAEVEGGRLEAEETVVAALVGSDEQCRCEAAFAACKVGWKHDVTRSIGAARRDHFVIAGDQADIGLRFGRCAGERVDEDVDTVIARKGGEADIGNDKPLGREFVVAVRLARRRLGRHHVNARRDIADRLFDWKGRGHFGVELDSRP